MEEELNDNFENQEEEEEEEKANKLEVIMEANIFSENFSTNKKPFEDQNKSASSSKFQESNFKRKEFYNENTDINKNDVKKNFQNDLYFNDKAPEKEELIENDIIESDIKNIIDYKQETKQIGIVSIDNNINDNNNELINDNVNRNQNNNNIKIDNNNENEDKDFIIEENRNIDNNENSNKKEEIDDINNVNSLENDDQYNKNNQFINDSNKKSEYNQLENIKRNLNNNNNNEKENINMNNDINSNLKNDEDENQPMELYSYEGNENNNDDNNVVKDKEELIINQNIINSPNDFNKINEKKENNSENKNEKYLPEIPYLKENKEEENINKERKRSGVIQLDNFKMSKNNTINNEEEVINDCKNKLTISLNNKDNIDEEIEKDKEKERQLSSQKGAMKILQLLISKKQEKEESEKIKEENLIEKFKKARKNLEIETLTDKNILSDNNTNAYNNKNTIKVEEKISDNDKNDKDINNDIILGSERNKINKDRVYIKNTKKIPYRKFKINSNKNNQNKMNENKNEFDVVNSSEINKYKTINNKNNIYNKNNYNTNPSTIENEIYKKVQYKKPITPFNDYIDSENKQPLRNKRKNNYYKEDHSMMFPNDKALKSIENSFDISTVYKKRNINNKALKESPPSPIIYSYKRPINKRKNSYEKYNSIQPNKYDINEVIKNKRNNLDMNKSQLVNNYSKNYPTLNTNYSNHKTDTNLNSYDYSNKKRNNKKKYLYTSKTSNNFNNDRKNFINYNELDISNDKINYNRYKNINNNNNIYNHYMKNNNDNNFYNKNKNYNSIDYFSYQSNRNRINNNYNNQSVSYINSNKNKIKNKFISNNNYESEDEEEYNFFGNHMVNNYINNNYNYYNYNEENYNYNNINKPKGINNSISINIEELLIFEDKLNEIIYFLKNKKEVNVQCINFWNFFFDSSLYQKIEKTFIEEKDIGIIILSIKYELLSIMLCYEFSFDKKVLNKAYILMLEILELNHRNLMIICENILNKITLENQENIWVLKLNEIVKNFKKGDDKYYMNETYAQKIIYNTDKISKKIRNILLNYKTKFSVSIMTLLMKINHKNYEEINDFFTEYILRMENIIKPLNNSQFGKNQTFEPRPPYILSPREKPYTLVLGLDETLANFQQINYTQGVLKLRPYLIEFLENVSRYYELILFTSKTQYYAEPIIRAIEQKKKYFDFIFYRENCIYVQNDLVKDLTRIGRPLDSIIIVDNMPQYFKLQKENGIHIKSFWAQEPNDRALYDLIPILINIALEEIDARDGLIKYRNEIKRKITSNNF